MLPMQINTVFFSKLLIIILTLGLFLFVNFSSEYALISFIKLGIIILSTFVTLKLNQDQGRRRNFSLIAILLACYLFLISLSSKFLLTDNDTFHFILTILTDPKLILLTYKVFVPFLIVILAFEMIIVGTQSNNAPQKIPAILRFLLVGVSILTPVLIFLSFGFGVPLTGVLATSGLITAIIGLALQSNLSNIVSGMFLTLERPFKSGDWISVDGEDLGQVRTISWRTTRLMSLENTEISIPNDKLARSSIVNLSINDENLSTGGYIIYDKISVHPRHDPKYIIELIKDGLAGSHPADGRSFFGYTNAWLGGSSENGLDFWIAYDCTNRWYQYSQRSVVMLAINHVFTTSGVTMTAGNLLQNMKSDANLKVIEDFSQNESNYRSLHTANNNIYLESQVVELWFKRVPLFEPLTARDFKALTRSSIKRDFKPDEIIIKQGDDGESMFVVMEGVVGVEVANDKKKTTQVTTLSIGDIFGEMSLLTGAKRTASIRAIRPVVVYEITKPMFAKIFKSNKKAIDGLTRILVERQKQLDTILEQHDDESKESKSAFDILKKTIIEFFKF